MTLDILASLQTRSRQELTAVHVRWLDLSMKLIWPDRPSKVSSWHPRPLQTRWCPTTSGALFAACFNRSSRCIFGRRPACGSVDRYGRSARNRCWADQRKHYGPRSELAPDEAPDNAAAMIARSARQSPYLVHLAVKERKFPGDFIFAWNADDTLRAEQAQQNVKGSSDLDHPERDGPRASADWQVICQEPRDFNFIDMTGLKILTSQPLPEVDDAGEIAATPIGPLEPLELTEPVAQSSVQDAKPARRPAAYVLLV